MTAFEQARALLAECGLEASGFHPTVDHRVPANTGTIIVAGAATTAVWEHFRTSPEYQDGQPDPLNRWSRRVLNRIAARLHASTAFPFGGPPHWPFLEWCAVAEPLWPSPIGMYVHARYGLWYSCRGALTFAEKLELPPRSQPTKPCDNCVDQPCRSACPVDAFANGIYDAECCTAHVTAPAGEPCLRGGCLARHACPVGREFCPPPERAEFHMRAFVTNPPQACSKPCNESAT